MLLPQRFFTRGSRRCAEFAEPLFENLPQRPRYIQRSVRKDFGRGVRGRTRSRGGLLADRPLYSGAALLSMHSPKISTLGSAFGRSPWRGLSRSSANSAGRGGGGVQGASLRELRVNHVAHQCPSAERVQIPRLRAARFARDDMSGSAARSARDASPRCYRATSFSAVSSRYTTIRDPCSPPSTATTRASVALISLRYEKSSLGRDVRTPRRPTTSMIATERPP